MAKEKEKLKEETQKQPRKEMKVKQKAEKIHEKHLTELQALVNQINTIQFNIGKMEIQNHSALLDLTKTQRGVSEMQDTLMREYGTFDVNVSDGTINWPQAKPESNGVDKPKEDEK